MIRYIQYVFPNLIANKIYKYLSYPRVRKLRESESEVLSNATTTIINYKGFSLKQYEWGNKNDKIAYLVHGWEGQTGNFAALIPVLLEANYRIISIDAPSHGESSIGKTNMFEFSKILTSCFKKDRPNLVISHSFGSVNVARVLKLNPDIDLKLWLMITTPNNFKSRINEMAIKFHLSHKITKKIISKIEIDVDESIENLNMVNYCKKLSNVEKAVIVHSKSDKILPIDGAREVNHSFRQSEIVELDNLGHYSILWSQKLKSIVINKIIN